MFQSHLRRTATRVGLATGVAVVTAVTLPGVAQAHVSVQPSTTEGGGFSVIAFRVPNEREDASTTRVQVTLPKDQPIGEVQTTPIPGWKVATATRNLDQPVEVEGEQLTKVVSRVTWTATAGGVQPEQFQDFQLSLGQLPDRGSLAFNTVQTYSDGENVSWNQVSADPSVEAEHPAPTLTLTPAEAGAGDQATGSGAAETPAASDQAADVTAPADEGSDSTLPLLLSGAALVLSVVALVLAWRRGRVGAAPAAPAERSRHDVHA
ncbi:MAG: YcnI family protein [Nocardioidaceae bacterium]|nr:YcnI family protein [Nocardioidaceae bacterium]